MNRLPRWCLVVLVLAVGCHRAGPAAQIPQQPVRASDEDRDRDLQYRETAVPAEDVPGEDSSDSTDTTATVTPTDPGGGGGGGGDGGDDGDDNSSSDDDEAGE